MIQFRPVSLCNTLYKIITKIIINRIKPFLHQLISHTQSAFQRNKRLIDNVIIVQELHTHFRHSKSKSSNMLLKMKIEKAFDRMKWSFIRRSLTFFNFTPQLISLICHVCQQLPLLYFSMAHQLISSPPHVVLGKVIHSPLISLFYVWKCCLDR